MARTPAKSRSKRAPAAAKKPRAAERSARKSAPTKSAKAAPKARVAKASKPAPKARAKKVAAPAQKPAKPKVGALRQAAKTNEAESPSLARYVREDHKLRESMQKDAMARAWWDGALRSAVRFAAAGARMVRRYLPGSRPGETEERDTLVPA